MWYASTVCSSPSEVCLFLSPVPFHQLMWVWSPCLVLVLSEMIILSAVADGQKDRGFSRLLKANVTDVCCVCMSSNALEAVLLPQGGAVLPQKSNYHHTWQMDCVSVLVYSSPGLCRARDLTWTRALMTGTLAWTLVLAAVRHKDLELFIKKCLLIFSCYLFLYKVLFTDQFSGYGRRKCLLHLNAHLCAISFSHSVSCLLCK